MLKPIAKTIKGKHGEGDGIKFFSPTNRPTTTGDYKVRYFIVKYFEAVDIGDMENDGRKRLPY